MERIPEKELMDSEEQVRAYAAEDYSEPHNAFISHFRTRFPEFKKGDVLDLGCGPADITIRFARAYPHTYITGLDGAQPMLLIGINDIRKSELSDRITLKRCLLPDSLLKNEAYDAVISNSLLHHLNSPAVMWHTIRKCAKPGASVFVMDLMRPESREHAQKLVEQYATDAPDILKTDFYNSLLAAYQIDEVRKQLLNAGLHRLCVEVVSDRHFIAWGTV